MPSSSILVAACFALLTTTALGSGQSRQITVVNQCTFPLWPALFTSVGPRPTHATGWKAAPGSHVSFPVEEGCTTGCDFSDSTKADYAQCETGGCIGGLQCDPYAGTGVPPVTLSEFNLQAAVDNYDTSNVDGFSVPLAITTSSKKCPLSNCPYDLLAACPKDLRKKNDKGKVVGCMTACGKYNTEEYCCSGAHSTPETCPSSGVKHYDWWKRACPIAYAYAYDEASGTALFTCSERSDYTVTFCPDKSLFKPTALLPNGTTITQGSGLHLMPTFSAQKKQRRSSARGHGQATNVGGSSH
ncbi:hypothetical protein JCM9279_001255 [Rhodotorula babjevae]